MLESLVMPLQNVPALISAAPLYYGLMPDAEVINQNIIHAYLKLREKDLQRRSHYFGGRYENLYFAREKIPDIVRVVEQAEYFAGCLLKLSSEHLRSGFWINDMGPNEVTSEHNHDDTDELLSAVYYVQVPKDSGELVIQEKYSRTLISPQEGMFVFFAPDLMHSVQTNCSNQRRISIGMNFGPGAG
jgi:hypothetical protein